MNDSRVSHETSAPDLTAAPTSFRTSEMTPLLVEFGDSVLSYAPVCFDLKPERKPVFNKAGKAFGSTEACEAMPMSAENARWTLASIYGMDTALAMLHRADAGEYVFGEKRDLGGHRGKGKIRGGTNVAADRSRPGGYVIQTIAFIQGGIK